MLQLPKISNIPFSAEIHLPVSKSIVNRLMLIQMLSGISPNPDFIDDSNDIKRLYLALNNSENIIDFEDAGTPLRFFLAFAALKYIQSVITGSKRLQERPIKDLLLALEHLGARFKWFEKPYSLPLQLVQKIYLSNSEVTIDGSQSSQFVSALLLIAPMFENGLKIKVIGESTSVSYINLTKYCMGISGINVQELNGVLSVSKGNYTMPNKSPESDWSAACFVYAWLALRPGSTVFLPNLYLNSAQGDSLAADIFKNFGVHSSQLANGIHLSSQHSDLSEFSIDLNDIPDMFPILFVLCCAKKIKANFSGLKNLQLKESDRIKSMRENMQQTGAVVEILDEDSLQLSFQELSNDSYFFKSFNDHRIAMACSIFAFEKPITIDDESVVQKSFPDYWNVFQTFLYV